MYRPQLVILIISCLPLLACSAGKESPWGFSLPQGDAEAGKADFVALQCNACHVTPDVEQLTTDEDISVKLGGKVGHVKTYADLVTSIINPSHRLASGYPADMLAKGNKSRMRVYNDVMTVEQLINLVGYLQPHYEVQVPRPSTYRGYYR